nr:AAA family ATPase [Herpetosiphonaceae bacterium]
MDALDRSHLIHLLQINRAHLRTLEVQSTTLGLHAPSHLAIQIADYQQQIATLETQLSQVLPAHNLPPRDYGTFVGRQAEFDQIHQLLQPYPRSRHHVITIDGIGGIGKSTLALETAYRYRDSYASMPAAERFEAIVWVSAKRLHLSAHGMHEQHQTFRTLTDLFVAIADVLEHPAINLARADEQRGIVERTLSQQRTLLILDNLETVDDEELLLFVRMVPDPTKVIVTTRHRIDVAYPIRLSGMPQADAYQLIEQEAQRKHVTLTPTIHTELWRRTGGLPLAIVWSIGLMGLGGSVESVLRRLSDGQSDIARFCFEASVSHIRQHDAHWLLMALALFATDASREALGVVAGLADDPFGRDMGLEKLLRLSLINKEGDRFSLLPLTREYALAEGSGYGDWMRAARTRWEQYFYSLVETFGGWSRDWTGHDRVERNLANIQAVLNSMIASLRYTESHDGSRTIAPESLEQTTIILEFIPRVARTCRIRGYWVECERLCLAAIELAKAINTLDYLGWRYYDVSRISYYRGDFSTAQQWAQESRSVWLRQQYVKGICNAERILGLIALRSGNLAEAARLINGSFSVYQATGEEDGLAHHLGSMGELAEHHGAIEAAKAWYEQA